MNPLELLALHGGTPVSDELLHVDVEVPRHPHVYRLTFNIAAPTRHGVRGLMCEWLQLETRAGGCSQNGVHCVR